MRYKKYKRRSSRVIRMSFQSFFDIATEDGTMQIISVNAGGTEVLKRLSPFFQAYKYYKLGGVSFKLIPASTLPVDPTGLSYDEGDNLVDPRDQLTPGMCRITNGEDILEDITGLTAEQQHQLYDNMLLDPRWFKWMLQSGVKRFGKPKYWQIGQLHQDKWPGAIQNFVDLAAGVGIKGTANKSETGVYGQDETVLEFKAGSDPRGIFQTGHRGVLGWMPTDSYQPIAVSDSNRIPHPLLASIPEVELFKILMPPAYKTKYYYRAFVTETVYFKEPIVMNVNGFRPIDVFHVCSLGSPRSPASELTGVWDDSQINSVTGGNDGSS